MVSSMYEDVSRWQEMCGLRVGSRVALLEPKRFLERLRLIHEELTETIEAQTAGDVVEVADGLADLTWVTLGTAVEMGLPFDEVWNEVRRSNYTKVGGKIDSGGKFTKPSTYSPANIGAVLRPYLVP